MAGSTVPNTILSPTVTVTSAAESWNSIDSAIASAVPSAALAASAPASVQYRYSAGVFELPAVPSTPASVMP